MDDSRSSPACLCHCGAVDKASELLAILANEQRLMLVALLREVGELHVGAMAQDLGVDRSALSRHLKRLLDMDLLTTRRDGTRVYYALDRQNASRLLEVLDICLDKAG